MGTGKENGVALGPRICFKLAFSSPVINNKLGSYCHVEAKHEQEEEGS